MHSDDLSPPTEQNNVFALCSLEGVDDHWVYLAYGVDNTCLYVGISGQGRKRLSEHRRTSDWSRLVSRIEVEHHRTRKAALERERKLIRKLKPPYNTMLQPKVRKDASMAIRPDGVMTLAQVALVCQLPLATVVKATKRGELDASATGMVTPAALHTWKDRLRVVPA
jgi:predicted GIY-YIG superfamily endonuclease